MVSLMGEGGNPQPQGRFCEVQKCSVQSSVSVLASLWVHTPCRAGESRWPALRGAVNTSLVVFTDRWVGFPGWCWARLGFSFPKLEAEHVAGNSAEAGRGSQALHMQHLGSRTGSPQPCSSQVLPWEEHPSPWAHGLVSALSVGVLAVPWHSVSFGRRLSLLTQCCPGNGIFCGACWEACKQCTLFGIQKKCSN